MSVVTQMPTDTPTISEIARGEIRVWMARRGITQAQLGAVISGGQAGISKRLRGAQPITLDDIEDFARAFGIPATVLLTPSLPVSVTHQYLTPFDPHTPKPDATVIDLFQPTRTPAA